MEFLIPLKDILIGPGKRFDPSTSSEQDVIALIKKPYGFLAETMEVSIQREEIALVQMQLRQIPQPNPVFSNSVSCI